jgi:GMP synthase (glutamine-hydrolysing)
VSAVAAAIGGHGRKIEPATRRLDDLEIHMQKTAIALRHVHFEDLGSFSTVLAEAGYRVRILDVGVDDLSTVDVATADLLIVLGGPIGVYETEAYPMLRDEIHLLETRLAARRPTLGICLGAQLIAAALGADVRPMGVKEIGFTPVTPTGQAGILRHFADVPVLHWHGDMADVPAEAERLAETPVCRNQAFSVGPNILALQFHPEIDVERSFERWLIGHACELAGAGIDPRTLRAEAARHGARLRQAGRAMLTEWLVGLDAPSS